MNSSIQSIGLALRVTFAVAIYASVCEPKALGQQVSATHDAAAASPSPDPANDSAKLELASPAITIAAISSGGAVRGLLSLKSGGPADRLEFFCSPLRPDGDSAPRPGPDVSSTPETRVLPPADPRDILLDFKVPQIPAGKYTGHLFVRYKDRPGTTLSVPLTLDARHDWPWPLAILIFGVFVGAVVVTYRNVGRQRDLAYLRLGRIRSEMGTDPKFPPELRAYVEDSFLATSEMYVRNGDWSRVEENLKSAGDVWLRWLSTRTEWINLLECLSEYERAVARMSPAARAARDCRDELTTLRREVPRINSVDAFRTRLEGIHANLETFRYLSDKIELLEKTTPHLPSVQQPAWLDYIAQLRAGLDDLNVADKAAVSAFDQSIKDRQPTLPDAATEQRARASAANAGEFPVTTIALSPVPIPGGRGQNAALVRGRWQRLRRWASETASAAFAPENAGARLTLFSWVAWFVTMAVLVYTGLDQLYWNKPTFGSAGDYLTLVGWGFGSNASSSAIVQAFNGAPRSAGDVASS
jgi:hypothetical protein